MKKISTFQFKLHIKYEACPNETCLWMDLGKGIEAVKNTHNTPHGHSGWHPIDTPANGLPPQKTLGWWNHCTTMALNIIDLNLQPFSSRQTYGSHMVAGVSCIADGPTI
jgi:hypothetical protein